MTVTKKISYLLQNCSIDMDLFPAIELLTAGLIFIGSMTDSRDIDAFSIFLDLTEKDMRVERVNKKK